MSDKTIRLTVDLTYNPDTMHGDDEDSIEWFNSMLFGDDLQLVDFGDLGDMIGAVKVVADRIEELESKLAKAVEALEAGVICTTKHGGAAEFLRIARTTLAELKGDQL